MSNLVTTNNFPSIQDFQMMKELGNVAVKSGLIPSSINTAEKALIIMLKGRELGIPPMQAFSDIAVINGKPAMAASLMVALGFKSIPGLIINYLVTTNELCKIEVKRPGGKMTEFSFSIEDAKRAGLVNKGPWSTYPAAMLRARCVSAMARAVFPDALSGVVYTPEELGADVDEEGTVLEAAPTEKPVTESFAAIDQAKNPVPELFMDEQIDEDLGDFVCTFGKKHPGKKLKDFAGPELDGFIIGLRKFAAERGGSMNPTHAIFIEKAEEYLKSMEFDRDGKRA